MKENHVVALSGGRTSGHLGFLMEQRKKREDINVEYIFCDTGAEHEDTYRFLADLVSEWEIELTCLRTVVHPERGVGVTYEVIPLSECHYDLKPFKAICQKYGTPYNPSGGHCTDFLKTIPTQKYCDDKYGRGNWIKWLGMRVDEPERIAEVERQIDAFPDPELQKKGKKAKQNIKYYANICDFDKQDVIDWWEDKPFDLKIDTDIEGNCTMCIKKPNNKVALSAKKNPNYAAKFIEMVEDPSVPVYHAERTTPKEIMYRDGHSLKSIIKMYEDFSEEEIRRTMRGYKEPEAVTCAESCEATVANYDLFDV